MVENLDVDESKETCNDSDKEEKKEKEKKTIPRARRMHHPMMRSVLMMSGPSS